MTNQHHDQAKQDAYVTRLRDDLAFAKSNLAKLLQKRRKWDIAIWSAEGIVAQSQVLLDKETRDFA
jgi:hypothetical protein